jgi:cytochrome P450
MLAEAERSYEVYQRQTSKDIPVAIPGGFWQRPEYLADPYPTLALLREHYRCFQDWPTNTHWVTSYDEVTSLIADEANFGVRPRHAIYGMGLFGRDLRDEPPVRDAIGFGMQSLAETVAAWAAEGLPSGRVDLIDGFVQPFTVELLARVVGMPDGQAGRFGDLWRAMQEGVGWHPGRADAGMRALTELEEMVAQMLVAPGASATPSVLSAALDSADGASPDGVARDIMTTLLELDFRTLEGSLANLFCLLLTHDDQLEMVIDEPDLIMRTWQEAMRHSPAVMESHRFARREVERFGRLIPRGSLVVCSAGAANRDPDVFWEPDRFCITRKDLAHREPRGQFRMDGLPSGIAPGLVPLSRMPALPADRPPSLYALTADAAVAATTALLERWGGIRPALTHQPGIGSRWAGDERVCRRLLVEQRG